MRAASVEEGLNRYERYDVRPFVTGHEGVCCFDIVEFAKLTQSYDGGSAVQYRSRTGATRWRVERFMNFITAMSLKHVSVLCLIRFVAGVFVVCRRRIHIPNGAFTSRRIY